MKAANQQPAIPSFSLYGENRHHSQPEFVHVEDIATRSRQHSWEIKPHRHGKLYQLLCLYDGEMQVVLDDQQLDLQGNWLVSIPPGCVHGFRFPADTNGVVLTVVEALLSAGEQQLDAYFDTVLHQPQAVQFAADGSSLAQIKHCFRQIETELAQRNNGHVLMLRWLVKMLLMTLSRQIESRQVQQQVSTGQTLLRFRELLDQHYAEHWTVQTYADHLHTSSSTLNRLCRKQLGVSAKVVIQNRVLLEAKRRLIYTRETNERIAYTLGFKDPSYFSRFFKQCEGVSPTAYRSAKYRETGTSW
ncbi:MAG: helix-turn-helix domain-containing protein [Thiolinea sp.]